jgi:hypothetical protein
LRPGLAIFLLAATAAMLAIADAGLQRFPNSGDEYSYLLQAKLFAAGRLSSPSAPESVREAFSLDHVIDDGRVRSKYPPGWPLLLAVGEALGLAWAVNPLLGAATLALLWSALARCGAQRAAWGAIAVLGASPFFLLNAASHFSHPSLLFALALAGFALVRAAGSQSAGWPLACGAALAFAMAIRPLEGLLGGVAALACAPLLGWRRCVWIALGGLPVTALHALYNEIQFGAFFRPGYVLYAPVAERLYPGGTEEAFGPSNLPHWREHLDRLVAFAAWTLPGAFALAPLARLPERAGLPRRCLHRYLAGVGAAGLAALPFYAFDAGDQYGPRFLHPLLLPLAGLAGLALEAVGPALPPRRVLAAAIALPLSLALAVTLRETGRAQATIAYRSTLYRLVEGARLRNAVVLLEHSDDYPPHWFTRNGIDFSAPVVYARGDVGLEAALRAFFPRRDFYRYTVDPLRGQRVLVQLGAPAGP